MFVAGLAADAELLAPLGDGDAVALPEHDEAVSPDEVGPTGCTPHDGVYYHRFGSSHAATIF
jgi:hypothetical protein